MVPFLLPSILKMAEDASDTEYRAVFLPNLIPLFRLKEPVQVSSLHLLLKTLLNQTLFVHKL